MSKEFKLSVANAAPMLMEKSRRAILPSNRALFSGAATLLCELRDRLSKSERDCSKLKKENAGMAAVLKEEYGCAACKHQGINYPDPKYSPCAKCPRSEDRPKWVWKGGGAL